MDPISPATSTTKDAKKKAVSKTIKKILKPGEKKKKQKIIVINALKKLITYLTENCLELEGLCRISGNITKVKELKKSLENEEDVDFSKIMDKHSISGALKMFLRDMDEPLLTFDLYKNFLGAYDIKDRNAKIAFIKSLISALPKENGEILQMVLKFLYTLQLHQEKNKMTSANIAIVFAPTMLRPKEESFETMMNASNYTMDIVKMMVEEFNVLYEINNTILYKISSEHLGKSVEESKSVQELLDEANAKIETLMKQAAEDAKERSVLETYSHQLNNKLQEEQENIKSLQEEKESIGELLTEMRESNKSLEERSNQQKEEIESLKRKLDELNNKSKESEGQLVESNKQIKLIQQDLDKQKKQTEDQKKQSDDLKKQNDDLKKQSEEIKKQNDDLKKQTEDQKKSIDEQKRLLEVEKKEKEAAIKTVSDQQSAATSNNSSKKDIERLQKESTDKSKDIERLQKENQEKIKDIKNKSDQIEKLTKERDEAVKANNNNRKSNTPAKEIEDLQKKIKDNESKIIQLEKEKEVLNETVKSLSEQSKQQTTSTTDNSSSSSSSSSTGLFKKPAFTIGKRGKQQEKEKTPQLQDEDDITAVKQFAFYWMILSLKSDALLRGKPCNISSSDVLEELLSKKIKVNQWNEYVSKKLNNLD